MLSEQPPHRGFPRNSGESTANKIGCFPALIHINQNKNAIVNKEKFITFKLLAYHSIPPIQQWRKPPIIQSSGDFGVNPSETGVIRFCLGSRKHFHTGSLFCFFCKGNVLVTFCAVLWFSSFPVNSPKKQEIPAVCSVLSAGVWVSGDSGGYDRRFIPTCVGLMSFKVAVIIMKCSHFIYSSIVHSCLPRGESTDFQFSADTSGSAVPRPPRSCIRRPAQDPAVSLLHRRSSSPASRRYRTA